jgi:hypothetical protein
MRPAPANAMAPWSMSPALTNEMRPPLIVAPSMVPPEYTYSSPKLLTTVKLAAPRREN